MESADGLVNLFDCYLESLRSQTETVGIATSELIEFVSKLVISKFLSPTRPGIACGYFES
ncbi:unnamed protein product [Acidithrix sp. C25]|nr:unnamed protein product [Acidithrix sp. C25]